MILRLALVLSLLCLRMYAANLIPNSSFECGIGRGWLVMETSSAGNVGEFRYQLTNDAFHGKYSLRVAGLTYTRAIWLTNGNYCFTFYAKCLSGSQGPFIYGMLDGDRLFSGVPTGSSTITTSWARYTNSFTVTSNAFYWAKWSTIQPGPFLVDAFQLEPGTSPAAYAPQSTVEMALSIPNTNCMWFSGDYPQITFNFRNEGGAINSLVQYGIFDLWNSNIFSGNVTVPLAASTNTTRTVSLPTSRTGWFRIISRLSDVSDSYDEATTVVYPYASNITANATTDWLGGHPHSTPFNVHREMLANRKWGRSLSPSSSNTRWITVEPTRGNFTFIDSVTTNLAQGGMIQLGTLHLSVGGVWPHWATNSDGTADMGALSNFCFTVVDRYKAYCTNWEALNEPYQVTSPTPINLQYPSNYALAVSHMIRGITNADPNAKIVFGGGAYGGGEWVYEAWTNLNASSQSAITYMSTHIYPQDNSSDPNPGYASWFGEPAFSNPGGWIRTFRGIRPVWNTESGTYSAGPIQGLNGMWPVAYNVQTNETGVEANRNEVLNRQMAATQRILVQALRCIGWGFQKYFKYDSRIFNLSSFSGTQPYPADYLQVDTPQDVSLSVANKFILNGLGPITNLEAGRGLESYLCTNATQVVLPIWSGDRTNRIMTVTNSEFAAYDLMGNLIQTNLFSVNITRMPIYLLSSTMGLSSMSNTVKHATLSTNADVLAPNISFDIAPTGPWSGDPSPTLIKWTALDDTVTAWRSNWTSTNVVYRWKLDEGSYSSYSQSNHVWISGLSAGNHTFYVTALDSAGNSAEASYEFYPSLNLGGGHPLLLKKKTSVGSIPEFVSVCAQSPSPYLIWQGFECSPYDHGPELWTTNFSGALVNPGYTGVVLAGSKSLRIQGDGVTQQGELLSPSFGSLLGEVWIYFLFRPVTLPSSPKTIFALEDASPGSDRWVAILNTSGTITISSMGIDTSIGAMSAGTTYGVWIHKKSSATSVFSFGFSTNGVEPTSGNNFVTTGNIFTQTSGGFNLGTGGATSGTYDWLFDNVLAKTTQIGDNPP